MKPDRTIIILAAAPFAAILLAVLIASQIEFQYKPALIEAEVKAVSVADIKIVEREPFFTKSIISPMQISRTAKKGFPETPLAAVAPLQQKAEEPQVKISMILINNYRKMAIVNGIVLSEGDMIGKDKILKIEKDRVSIRGSRGEKWIKLSQ